MLHLLFLGALLGFILLRAGGNRLENLLPLVPELMTALDDIKAGDIVQLGRSD